MSDALDPSLAYYFNTRTGEVEQGLISSWTERMGPYATLDEAARAMQTHAQRNREWDEADREWDGD